MWYALKKAPPPLPPVAGLIRVRDRVKLPKKTEKDAK
jgi:hypothetical protein